MKYIDNILNNITMYRVVLYELLFLLIGALALSVFGLLPFAPMSIIFSTLFILAVCWFVNKIFAVVFNAPSNPESAVITALILSLIVSPASSLSDMNFLVLAFWASALAMASKYILAVNKKHIFNPAAIAVVVTAFFLNLSASWWIGTAVMAPLVALGGFLVVRKVRRLDMVWAFFMTSLVVILGFNVAGGGNIVAAAERIFLETPILFFASVMLTEPLTSPPAVSWQMVYGFLVGILFAPQIHLGQIYSTPELALVAGNVLTYFTGPKRKFIFKLEKISAVSSDAYDFVFTSDRHFSFRPGQYMELTLGHRAPDSRGIRRFFTIASSPTENGLRFGIKFHQNGSTFKKQLLGLKEGETVAVSSLSGDFVLPKDKNKKLVFIAGGIGITPFRSMIQYMIDKNEARPVALFYINKKTTDISYREIFDRAEKNLGLKTVYAITNPDAEIPLSPNFVRVIDARVISEKVPDYKERTFYLSGPRGLVTAFDKILQAMSVKKNQIKKDFFPGFA